MAGAHLNIDCDLAEPFIPGLHHRKRIGHGASHSVYCSLKLFLPRPEKTGDVAQVIIVSRVVFESCMELGRNSIGDPEGLDRFHPAVLLPQLVVDFGALLIDELQQAPRFDGETGCIPFATFDRLVCLSQASLCHLARLQRVHEAMLRVCYPSVEGSTSTSTVNPYGRQYSADRADGLSPSCSRLAVEGEKNGPHRRRGDKSDRNRHNQRVGSRPGHRRDLRKSSHTGNAVTIPARPE